MRLDCLQRKTLVLKPIRSANQQEFYMLFFTLFQLVESQSFCEYLMSVTINIFDILFPWNHHMQRIFKLLSQVFCSRCCWCCCCYCCTMYSPFRITHSFSSPLVHHSSGKFVEITSYEQTTEYKTTTRSTMWLIIKIDALVLYLRAYEQNNKRGTYKSYAGLRIKYTEYIHIFHPSQMIKYKRNGKKKKKRNHVERQAKNNSHGIIKEE